MPKMLTLSGSIRRGSYNAKLALLMGRRLRARGADVEDIDLGDYAMPIFNEDIENGDGVPETAMALGRKMVEAEAVFIASPEYNGGNTPLLINTIAWLSRTGLRPFASPTFGIGSVSSGPISGMLSLSHLRDMMLKASALTAPTQLWVGNSETAFDADGELTSANLIKRADALADEMMVIRRRPS